MRGEQSPRSPVESSFGKRDMSRNLFITNVGSIVDLNSVIAIEITSETGSDGTVHYHLISGAEIKSESKNGTKAEDEKERAFKAMVEAD